MLLISTSPERYLVRLKRFLPDGVRTLKVRTGRGKLKKGVHYVCTCLIFERCWLLSGCLAVREMRTHAHTTYSLSRELEYTLLKKKQSNLANHLLSSPSQILTIYGEKCQFLGYAFTAWARYSTILTQSGCCSHYPESLSHGQSTLHCLLTYKSAFNFVTKKSGRFHFSQNKNKLQKWERFVFPLPSYRIK